MTITLEKLDVENPTQLHLHYDCQSNPQPVYLYLNLDDRRAYIETWSNIGGGMPASVFNGTEIRWSLPVLTADSANDLLEKFESRLDRLCDEYEDYYDGSNYRGRLSEDGQDLQDRIQRDINEFCTFLDTVEAMTAADYYEHAVQYMDGSASVDGHTITSTSTDEDLDRIAEELEESGQHTDDTTVIITGISDFVYFIRDNLQVAQ